MIRHLVTSQALSQVTTYHSLLLTRLLLLLSRLPLSRLPVQKAPPPQAVLRHHGVRARVRRVQEAHQGELSLQCVRCKNAAHSCKRAHQPRHCSSLTSADTTSSFPAVLTSCAVFLVVVVCAQFDLCHVCFSRKSRVRGEGVIRGDKGVKEELEITSGQVSPHNCSAIAAKLTRRVFPSRFLSAYLVNLRPSASFLPPPALVSQYLLRALKLARPHCGLILVALVCLLMNAAAQLFAPNLQGSAQHPAPTTRCGPVASSEVTLLATHTHHAVVTDPRCAVAVAVAVAVPVPSWTM